MTHPRLVSLFSVIVAAVAASAVGCGTKEGAPPPVVPVSKPRPAEPFWVDDVAKMEVPDGPVRGQIEGFAFRIDKVDLFGGSLRLRQGDGVFGDVTLQVQLFGGPPKWQGKSWEVRPGKKEFFGPSLILTGKRVKSFGPVADEKVLLKISFGKIADGKLPGQVYLCLRDQARSYAAGNFVLDGVDEEDNPKGPPTARQAPFVHGKITVKLKDRASADGKGGRPRLSVGHVGRTVKGEQASGSVGGPIDANSRMWSGTDTVTTLSFETDTAGSHSHTRLPPGHYLVYATLDDMAADWRWVKVEEKAQVTADLTVDEGQFGRLEVKVPAKLAKQAVYLMPLLEGGKLPPMTLSQSDLGWRLKLEAKVQGGQAVFPKVRAGAFRVLAGDLRTDVKVEAGKTATADLGKEEE